MIIEQKKNDIFLIKHNFFYKNEKTHFRKLLTKIFACKHGIYNGRQFQEQFIISKRNLHTCAAIEGRCSLVVVVVVVVVAAGGGGGGGGGAVAAGVLTLSYQISHPWWLLLFWFCWDNVCKARIWIEHSVLCYALLFNLMAFQSQVFFQLINSGLSNVIELSLTITSSIGFQHAISLPLCFLVYKRSTWNGNTGLPPLLNADSSNFPELKPLVLEVPVDVACTCVRICSKTKQTIYKVR